MRINNAVQGRPAYYDRNPTDVSQRSAIGATGPHALTTRFTYTTPAGRKTFVTSIFQRWHRVTVAAPVGNVTLLMQSGGGDYVRIGTLLNAVDSIDQIGYGTQQVMLAAAIFIANSSDAGTGGTCEYFQSAELLEFDA